MGTKEKIEVKALEMFNERGIEYVGLRELAAVLGIRVSNITYYFPTKDDLVYALSQQLSRRNAKVLIEIETLSMHSFLEALHQVYQNQVDFRCLLLSVVHLMEQNKHLAATYRQTQNSRNETLRHHLQVLEARGYLRLKDESELAYLVSSLSLLNRFWLSEAALMHGGEKVGEQIGHYLRLLTKLLHPFSSPRARREMEAFLSGIAP